MVPRYRTSPLPEKKPQAEERNPNGPPPPVPGKQEKPPVVDTRGAYQVGLSIDIAGAVLFILVALLSRVSHQK